MAEARVFPLPHIDWLARRPDFCPACRHPRGPDGARIEGLDRLCKCRCHDSPEEEGR